MGLKKLFIDMEKLEEHKAKCDGECSYFYHPGNDGIMALQEAITYTLICRKCEKENCVNSCPFEALEKGPDKILRRANLRCTSCKTCSHACHSGVIWPEFIPYMAFNCDLCLERLKGGDTPGCVTSCSCGAVNYGNYKEDDLKDLYLVGNNIVARSVHWQREIKSKAKA